VDEQSETLSRNTKLSKKPPASSTSTLLSGIEAQRQKLQELKKGLNRKPSLTHMSPTANNLSSSNDRKRFRHSPRTTTAAAGVPGSIMSNMRALSSDRNRSRSTERKPSYNPSPRATTAVTPKPTAAQTYYERLRSASRERERQTGDRYGKNPAAE
jgi:hypothetical protein